MCETIKWLSLGAIIGLVLASMGAIGGAVCYQIEKNSHTSKLYYEYTNDLDEKVASNYCWVQDGKGYCEFNGGFLKVKRFEVKSY